MEQDPKDRVPVPEKDPVVPEQAETKRDAAGPRAGEPVKAPPRIPESAWQSWRKQMIRIMLAGRDQTSLAALEAGLAKSDVHIIRAESGGIGLSMIAEDNFDLVVADENLADMTGLEFIRAIVAKRPMVNCAAISSLTPEDFHEAGEGLGILMQLPVSPGQKQAEMLLEQLRNILNSMNA
jgi:CheY-like chemotaxis protein